MSMLSWKWTKIKKKNLSKIVLIIRIYAVMKTSFQKARDFSMEKCSKAK